MMDVEKISEDKRGQIYLFKLPKGREALAIFTNKGYLRGGEYHKSNQHTVVVSGILRWTYGLARIHFIGGQTFRVGGEKWLQGPGEACVIPKGLPHLAEALEDTFYFEWLDGELGKVLVPKMRKLVEERMKRAV